MAVKDDFASVFGTLADALKTLNASVVEARTEINTLNATVDKISEAVEGFDTKLANALMDSDVIEKLEAAARSVIEAITGSDTPAPKAPVPAGPREAAGGAVANAGHDVVLDANVVRPVNPLSPPVPAGTLPKSTKVAVATPGVVPVVVSADSKAVAAGTLDPAVTVVPVL